MKKKIGCTLLLMILTTALTVALASCNTDPITPPTDNASPPHCHHVYGEWVAVEDVKTNNDGSVTCVFEDLCPVAFAVKETAETSPYTGDAVGRNMGLWIAVMVVSLVGMVAVVTLGRKKKS